MKITEKLKLKNQYIYAINPITIAFVGDSVTQGCFEIYKTGKESIETCFDYENSYSNKLKQIISLLYPKAQINIINSGISGDNSSNGLKRLERDILSYSPDLTIVCYGLNDCTVGLNGINNYSQNLKLIFQKLKNINSEVIFMTPNMMNTEISCHINDSFIKDLAKQFLEIQNGNILKSYIEEAKKIALKENIKICDCYEKWEKLYNAGVNTTNLLSNNLNHPIKDMHWLFAFSLFEVIFFS